MFSRESFFYRARNVTEKIPAARTEILLSKFSIPLTESFLKNLKTCRGDILPWEISFRTLGKLGAYSDLFIEGTIWNSIGKCEIFSMLFVILIKLYKY